MVTPPKNYAVEADYHHWICPDIRPYWILYHLKESQQFLLYSAQHYARFSFSLAEGYALQFFTGQFTLKQIQTQCNAELTNIEPNLVANLIEKLINFGILESSCQFSPTPNPLGLPRLKSGVQWIRHQDGYWILRNSQDITFVQVSDRDYRILSQLPHLPPGSVPANQLKKLLHLLTVTGMLEGTTPAKPQRGKLTPLHLLFFQIPLFNPDKWLTRHIHLFHWIWTKPVAICLTILLTLATVIGLSQKAEILYHGQQLWTYHSSALILPFAILALLVVSLHELGHAFTLKHYGGIVPEIGILLMCFMPAAYTNTTDSYCLPRCQRILVVAAGILTQLIIAALALLLWNNSVSGSWLHTTSYLVLIAALFTVALNLNPLAKFDGYHLAVALTGINNLRSRSLALYQNFIQGKPIPETTKDTLILAIYAPFSIAYLWFIFSFLLFKLTDWIIIHIPTTALIILILWAIYFYFPKSPPHPNSQRAN
jgi:putative peptide zinc metalloprotease protein